MTMTDWFLFGFRYFYLIVFAMYIREVGPKDYNITFKQYMDEHAELRDMIAEGRSKLEWERKIPDEKLMDLKSMLDSPDFKTNLPKVNLFLCKVQCKCFAYGNYRFCLFSKSSLRLSVFFKEIIWQISS